MKFAKFTLWLAFVVTYTVRLLISNEWVPSAFKHITDLTAGLVFVALIAEIIRNRHFSVSPKYLVYSLSLLMLVLISAVANQQSVGSFILGIKTYFVYIPFFLLPFVVRFSDADLKPYLYFFLAVAIIQVPLALFQRFVQHADRMHNGDLINGTLGISSFLSIYLMCVIGVLLALYLRKQLSGLALAGLAVFLFIPTTLNETKGTLVLIPLVFAAPAIANAIINKRLREMVPVLALAGIVGTIFILVFNQIQQQVFDRDFSDIDLMAYSFQGKDIAAREKTDSGVIGTLKVNEEREIGRGDAMLYAFKVQSRSFVSLTVGLGLGNVTETNIGFLKGRFDSYQHLTPTYTVVSRIVWELGIMGVMMCLLILTMVFFDAFAVAKRKDLTGTLALGWLGVIAAMFMLMVYKDAIYATVLSYAFWFISGHICSKRVRVA